MFKLIALAAVCALPTAVLAQAAAPAAPAAPAAEEKPTCRYYRATGSIMPGKRICHSKEEWQMIDKQMSEAARHTMGGDRAGAGFGSSGGAPTGG